MKVLVVYYLRTGTTRKVAEAIAGILKCDIEEVLDKKSRSGALGWLRSGRDADSKKLTTIEETKKNPACMISWQSELLFGMAQCQRPLEHI